MFQGNLLWCTLDQNKGNEIYSLSTENSGTRNQGLVSKYHWLCEIGG